MILHIFKSLHVQKHIRLCAWSFFFFFFFLIYLKLWQTNTCMLIVWLIRVTKLWIHVANKDFMCSYYSRLHEADWKIESMIEAGPEERVEQYSEGTFEAWCDKEKQHKVECLFMSQPKHNTPWAALKPRIFASLESELTTHFRPFWTSNNPRTKDLVELENKRVNTPSFSFKMPRLKPFAPPSSWSRKEKKKYRAATV